MTLDPDPLTEHGFMDEGEPPRRRSGCVSVLPWIVLLILVALAAAGGAPQEIESRWTAVLDRAVAGTPAAFPEPSHGGSPSHLPVVASAAREPIASVPAPSGEVGTALVGGWATFYDDGPGRYAAVPTWRFGDAPYPVRVCRMDDETTCIVALVRDFCACGDRNGTPTVIDLSPEAMSVLEPAYERLGILRVTVEWPVSDDERMRLEVGDGLYTAPPTDWRVP